jgi:hypothetical protein
MRFKVSGDCDVELGDGGRAGRGGVGAGAELGFTPDVVEQVEFDTNS